VDNKEWVKVHLTCGVNTHIVTAAEVSGLAANDTTYFESLFERTAKHFKVKDMSGNKAYLSHKNLALVERAGGMPYVPFKTNTVVPSTDDDSTWAKMYHLYLYNRSDFLNHYHQRSNVESVFSMVKAKFGDSVRSKSDEGQVNEALCKILCHNICVLIQSIHELGIPEPFRAEMPDALKVAV
jgi:transposase